MNNDTPATSEPMQHPAAEGGADKLSRKILTGGYIALVCLLAILGSALFTFVKALQVHLVLAVVVYVVAGFGLLLVGRIRASKNTLPMDTAGSHPLLFLQTSRFWGGVVMTSALPIFLYTNTQLRAEPPALPSPPPPPAVVAAVPVVFPPLKLQGLVCNGDRSTAVINGQTLQVGDDIQGARVVTVDALGVTIEFQGATTRLELKD